VTDLWTYAKPLVEAGVMGAMLVLMIRMWIHTGNKWEEMAQQTIDSEKEHSKELLKIQAQNNTSILSIVRQYDSTLSSVEATLTKLMEKHEEES
jgi:hypothetical protein